MKATLIGLTLLAAATAALAADEGPQRKAGLWRQQLTFDGGAYPIPASEMCLDAAADRRLTLVGAQMQRRFCVSYDAERQRDGSWKLTSVCTLADGRIATTTGVAKGDFQTSYSVEATGVFEGAGKRETHTIVVAATYEGPCPAGQSGGDITTNGRTASALSER